MDLHVNKKILLSSIAIVLFTLLSSCTTKPPLRERIELPTGQKVETILRARSDSVVAFQATGTVEYATKKNSGSADVIIMRRNDSLRVDIRGPFGITLGKLLVTKDRILFYNSLEGQAYEGTTGDLPKLLPFELPAPGFLADMIIAALPRNAQLFEERHDSTRGTILGFIIDSEKVWYRLDPRTAEVQNISIGPNKLEAHYSEYHPTTRLPMHSIFKTHEATVEFRFQEIVINPDITTLALLLPAGVPRTILR